VFRDLLTEPWTADRLLTFLDGVAVANWFNRSAKRVKAGEVVPDQLGVRAALELLLADPALIRRPLLEVEGVCAVGWEPERIGGWIGLAAGCDPGTESCASGGHDHDHGPSHADGTACSASS
jgi:nitrogenase-associated protein